jgi:hypothetical protein
VIDIGSINRFDDSRIRNFLIKHASGLDFLATPTQREPVVRDEELQLCTGTMKIELFLSTWDTRALGRHAIRGHAGCMSRKRAQPSDNSSTSTRINRSIVLRGLSCIQGPIDALLDQQGWGNGGKEAWRVKGSAQSIRKIYMLMGRLQPPLVLSPCVPPSNLSLSVYNSPFLFSFCDMEMRLRLAQQ